MSKIDELIKKLCPNGVEYKTIGEIATYRRGSFPQPYTNSSFYGGEGAMPFVQVADIEDEGFALKDKTKQTISKIAQPKSIFVPKDTVICSIQGTIGRVAITQYDAYVDRTIAIFDGFKIDINKRFFAYCIQVKFGIEKKFARGSTLKTITKEEFTKFRIPVPPLEVQCEIVHVLDDFTLLSAELSAELKARQKQYEYYRDKLLTFDEAETLDTLHTHTHTHGYLLKNIKYYKLNEIAQIYDGTHQTPKYKNKGIPFISVENIKDIYNSNKYISIEDYNKYKIKPMINDIFMTRIGSIGKCAVFYEQEDVAYYVSLALIRPDSKIINSYYLKYLIESIIGKKELRKRTLINAVPIKINKEDIGKIILPIPSLDVQEKIVNILERFDKLCNNITNGLPAEIEARQKQYEYYRDKLLTFKELVVNEG